MKAKILILFLFIQSISSAQEIWRPLGNDDFNNASCGNVSLVGRKPIIVKNEHVFLFNAQWADDFQSSGRFRFSVSKYSEGQWQHMDFPFLFSSNPIIDCAIDSNEIPYVLFNANSENNSIAVKKFENGIWTDVGTGISAVSSNFLNIVIGTDNFPRILFRENNVIKLKKFDGINWVLLSETSEFIPYTSISLEIDNNNIPYVLSNYQVGSSYNCFVKKFNGSAWEEVGITGFSERGYSLVFDNFNVPHMFLNNIIKKFDGLAWENISTQLSEPYFGISAGINLFFNNSNEMYASFSGNYYMSPTKVYVKKLVGTTWQSIVSDSFTYDKVYTVSGDNTYHVSFGTDYQPDIYKINNDIRTKLGPSPYFEARSKDYDFSICNGIPLIAYKGSNSKAQVGMLNNYIWSNLGSLSISENEIYSAKIKSGTDGSIYLAYNNKISSSTSDTKLTVKKLNSTGGWELVGPVNFSLSAGVYFDFKMNHINEPYVLYMSGRVQKFDGNNWVFVGGSAFVGDTEARLALDSNDLLYIAYSDPSNGGRIAVKKLNGNVWEYIDQGSLAAYTGIQSPNIVIDALNNIYLGFVDNTDKVHIKKLNNGVWESVGSDFFNNENTGHYEIAVDHNNVLYVIYNTSENSFRRQAKVKRFIESNWEFVGEPNFSATSVTRGKIDFSANNTPIASFSTNNVVFEHIYTKFFGETNALGINEQELITKNPKWLVYPNPVTNTFSISGNGAIMLIEIFDITGKKLKVEDTNFNNIDTSSLNSGLYIVKVKTNSGTSAVKLIKE